jgi:beta-galactosidase beta subunit
MAKTKTKGTNAKIKELKGVKPEKITDQQLKNVQDTINALNQYQLEVGVMEIKKHEIMHNVAGMRDSLKALQSEFEKDYGTFDIDIQTGTINYKEDVEADS